MSPLPLPSVLLYCGAAAVLIRCWVSWVAGVVAGVVGDDVASGTCGRVPSGCDSGSTSVDEYSG